MNASNKLLNNKFKNENSKLDQYESRLSPFICFLGYFFPLNITSDPTLDPRQWPFPAIPIFLPSPLALIISTTIPTINSDRGDLGKKNYTYIL